MGNYWHLGNCTCPIAPTNWNMGMWILNCIIFLLVLGNKEHCPDVEVNLKTCYHHILTAISNLFEHYILILHGSTFGTRAYCASLDFYVSMGFVAFVFIII
jgi:hypothetical protein